jgi:hypothetical protein
VIIKYIETTDKEEEGDSDICSYNNPSDIKVAELVFEGRVIEVIK